MRERARITANYSEEMNRKIGPTGPKVEPKRQEPDLLGQAWAKLSQWEKEQLDNPAFEEIEGKVTLVHEWRGYVPEEARTQWSQLDRNARVIIYMMAKSSADNEEWD